MTTHKAIRDAAEEGPYYTAMVAKPDLRALLDDLDAKTAELETERLRLAACGVVARANTPESAKKAREMSPEYWSASAQDVASAVDREMAMRDDLRALRREPMTDRMFDLICAAIDKADTITMDADYMLDSDDCIRVVRTMQALIDVCGITQKEQGK